MDWVCNLDHDYLDLIEDESVFIDKEGNLQYTKQGETRTRDENVLLENYEESISRESPASPDQTTGHPAFSINKPKKQPNLAAEEPEGIAEDTENKTQVFFANLKSLKLVFVCCFKKGYLIIDLMKIIHDFLQIYI